MATKRGKMGILGVNLEWPNSGHLGRRRWNDRAAVVMAVHSGRKSDGVGLHNRRNDDVEEARVLGVKWLLTRERKGMMNSRWGAFSKGLGCNWAVANVLKDGSN